MMDIGIAAVPNQSLTVQLDDRVYDLTLREANGVMAASIARDGVDIIKNVRITAGTPLLPYQYQEAGNFLMTTEGDELIYYSNFDKTQFLLYLTPEELAVYRGA